MVHAGKGEWVQDVAGKMGKSMASTAWLEEVHVDGYRLLLLHDGASSPASNCRLLCAPNVKKNEQVSECVTGKLGMGRGDQESERRDMAVSSPTSEWRKRTTNRGYHSSGSSCWHTEASERGWSGAEGLEGSGVESNGTRGVI